MDDWVGRRGGWHLVWSGVGTCFLTVKVGGFLNEKGGRGKRKKDIGHRNLNTTRHIRWRSGSSSRVAVRSTGHMPTPERNVLVERHIVTTTSLPCVRESRGFFVGEHKTAGDYQQPTRKSKTRSMGRFWTLTPPPAAVAQALYLQGLYESYRDHLAVEGQF